MKIALAQLNFHIGNFDDNFRKMADAVHEAEGAHADIIVFPELAVCGYPPRDFLEFSDFIDHCYACIEKLRALSQKIAIIAGSPSRNPVPEGKDLFNSAFFLYEEKVLHVAHKALLPNYDIFDEYRYFEPAQDFRCVSFRGKKIALTICEDLWNTGNTNPMYRFCPMDILVRESPDCMINISASPFDYGQAARRLHVLAANARQYKLPLFYVNHCGAQTDLIFDGGSAVMNAEGAVYDEMPYFRSMLRYYELDEVMQSGGSSASGREQPKEKIPLIHDALVTGISNYFGKLHFTKAILGLSGGIDSALTAVLAAEALGPGNVHALLMPSPYSGKTSVQDAKALALNTGISYDIIPVDTPFAAFANTLKPFFNDLPFDVTEENLQARIRGMLLMAFCNKFGYILLNTSNKSEAAVGYGTLYGDMCGGIAVLADVYKMEVYALARFINRERSIIPESIIGKAPSAELRPGQTDQDTLPPYPVLDDILFQYIEKCRSPAAIIDSGIDADTVHRTLKMVNANEWKRFQLPPVLRVSPKAFGMGRRMPIEGKYLS